MALAAIGFDAARAARAALAGCALAFALLAASPAAAQAGGTTLADRLCALAPRPAESYPGDEGLRAVAAAAERSLAALKAGGDASAADRLPLDVPADEGAAPSDAALAAYCAAAGEAMRLGAGGSQAQAVTFLLGAYRRAVRAGDVRMAARAGYRLALVGAAGTGDGSRSGGIAADAAATDQTASGSAACAELDDLRLGAVTVRYLSVIALECAAEASLRADDARLAALANLRLSRLDGALAEQPAADRGELRRSAAARALATLPVALTNPPGTERAELVGRLADAALDFGAGADPAIIAAVDALRDEGDPQVSAIVAALDGRIALARGEAAAALTHLQVALLAESQRDLPARLPLLYLRLAEADPANAATHVGNAYAALDNLRPLLPRFDPLTEESSFALYMRDVFAAAVEVELAAATGAAEAPRIRAAQQIVEAYRQAELQSAFGSECLPPALAVRPEDLRPGETLLYPLLLPDRIELIYVAGGDGAGGAARYRRLPPNRAAGRAQVAQLVEQVVLSLSAAGDVEWRAPARQLYDLLIAPVADQLGLNGTLAIVPDGALRALPFAALLAPDGRYLVQLTRLSVIPALAYSQPEGVRGGHRLNVVAASLQRQINLSVGFFPELAGTEAEARIAVAEADAGRLVADFTRADLETALAARRIDVLHLATHATFNGRSDRAFIVANGEIIRLSELRGMIERSRTRGEPLDLIVLSACETAVGDDETGMGLAGAAVQAGARSVIGSLWQVSDAGTARLMAEFYRRYGAGAARSEALRAAQLALIDGGGSGADPNVWAAFALLGAWR